MCLARLLGLVAATAAFLGSSVAFADADQVVVAHPNAVGPLSAYGGWVVWSQYLGGTEGGGSKWALMSLHSGESVPLHVATRAVPFDVDLGPDERGRAVALYSRCKKEPLQAWGYMLYNGYAGPNGLPLPGAGSGCRPYRLDLETGKEALLHLPAPRGASISTPSQWRKHIAYGVRTRSASRTRVTQLAYWKVGSRSAMRLRHGTLPRACPYKTCKGEIYDGDIQQLDLSLKSAAFVWRAMAPAISGTGLGTEVRVSAVDGASGTLLASGTQSGTCGAQFPVSPNVVGPNVWFVQEAYDCDTPAFSVDVGQIGSGRVGAIEEDTTLTWQIAIDGGTLYRLVSPAGSENSQYPPCQGDKAPCALLSEPLPAVPPQTQTAHSFVF